MLLLVAGLRNAAHGLLLQAVYANAAVGCPADLQRFLQSDALVHRHCPKMPGDQLVTASQQHPADAPALANAAAAVHAAVAGTAAVAAAAAA